MSTAYFRTREEMDDYCDDQMKSHFQLSITKYGEPKQFPTYVEIEFQQETGSLLMDFRKHQ